jgi:hypothetical protein
VENNPYFHKVIGVPEIEPELKEKLNQFITHGVETEGGKFLEGIELEKTPQELKLVDFVTRSVDELAMKMTGQTPVAIPLNNIHILRKGGAHEATEERAMEGAHSVKLCSVFVERQVSETMFCTILFHEMVHAKSYAALQLLINKGEGYLLPYRSGVSVISRDGQTKYLEKLTEGITTYLTRQFYKDVLQKNIHLFSEENRKIPEPQDIKDRQEEIDYLYLLVQKIRNKHPEFLTDEQVIDELIAAQFTGKLMKIGRLIEEALGKGGLKSDTEKV